MRDVPPPGPEVLDAAKGTEAAVISSEAITEDVTSRGKEFLSHRRPLYFAYGSNLSPSQMRSRCEYNPDQSSRPVAIARIDHWRWLISDHGYANVIPPKELRVPGGVQEKLGGDVPVSGKEDAVFGVLYEMSAEDERLLDGYEGVDHWARKVAVVGDGDEDHLVMADGQGQQKEKTRVIDQKIRPSEQGTGSYNKWYFPATVIKWLNKKQKGRRTSSESESLPPLDQIQQVLIYVDEEGVLIGPPRTEYIFRMNRAIRESLALGMPEDWVESVIRPFIPRG